MVPLSCITFRHKGQAMLTGTMTSQLEGAARIWTLDVERTPRPGEVIEWSEPAVGSLPARTVRGWVSADQSRAREGTVTVIVADEGNRWVRIREVRTPAARTQATRTADEIDRAAMAHEAPGVPPARTPDYLTVDYAKEARRQANQAQRDYRRARSMERLAVQMDHLAAREDDLANWWAGRTGADPDAREQAERCRDNADSLRRLAQTQRDHASQWRAYARQAASLARSYDDMGARAAGRAASRTAR